MASKKKPTIGGYTKRKKADGGGLTAQVEIIVPPGLKVQRLPSISREEYFKGDNYYFKKVNRLFSN